MDERQLVEWIRRVRASSLDRMMRSPPGPEAAAPVNDTDYRYVRVCPDSSGRYRITG